MEEFATVCEYTKELFDLRALNSKSSKKVFLDKYWDT
jgi:hypothetical protein